MKARLVMSAMLLAAAGSVYMPRTMPPPALQNFAKCWLTAIRPNCMKQRRSTLDRKRGPRKHRWSNAISAWGEARSRGIVQLPKYFADTKRVQDLEMRLITCMETLQDSTPPKS